MIIKSKIHAQGFLNVDHTTQRHVNVESFRTSYPFDGLRLDEIQINATLVSEKDVKDLIDMLNSARYCFK